MRNCGWSPSPTPGAARPPTPLRRPPSSPPTSTLTPNGRPPSPSCRPPSPADLWQLPRSPLVEIKQLSPAARRPIPSRTNSTESCGRSQTAALTHQQLTADHSSCQTVINGKELVKQRQAAGEYKSTAAGGNGEVPLSGATNLLSVNCRTLSGEKISSHRIHSDLRGGRMECKDEGVAGTKIVFLGKDGHILAESRLTAGSPHCWPRQQLVDQKRPPLTASRSAEAADELVHELSSRLELWRSLNGSPTYPLPPYQPAGGEGGGDGSHLIINGGPGVLTRSGRCSAVGPTPQSGGRAVPFLITRQSTDNSQLSEDSEPFMPELQTLSAAIDSQRQLQSTRPKLTRQTRVSN